MARRSREEIEAAMAELQAELDNDDDDDTELWVEHPKTKAVGRLKGSHARSFLDSILGTGDEPDEPKAPKGKAPKGKPAPAADDDEPDDEPDPAPRSSVWGRK